MTVKKYRLSLFIFRRDLRLYDNTGLIQACGESKAVIPSFFFHEDLIDKNSSKFRPNLIQFMLESLIELDKDLRAFGSGLYCFYGNYYKDFEKLITSENITAVYINEDYTPYSIRRDRELKKICIRNGVDLKSCFDLLLCRPGDVLTGDGKPYRVFTSFYNKARIKEIVKPAKIVYKNLYRQVIKDCKPTSFFAEMLALKNDSLAQRGGRSNSARIIRNIENFEDYNKERDFPSFQGTTKLSAHLKFGTVSVREVYWAVRSKLGVDNLIIAELFWRDFYGALSYFFPHVFGHPFNKKYENIRWENDGEKFLAWGEGKTGFPIVDAGMRQLNKTGWMHNRVRMIVASFLTKDIHVDWRWGEKYFASKLVDYDPCSNNGGWQWAASTGADSQPYFRIFNPWRQQEKFDSKAIYIKKWLPELAGLSANKIHNLSNFGSTVEKYPLPIVEHKVEGQRSKEIYGQEI